GRCRTSSWSGHAVCQPIAPLHGDLDAGRRGRTGRNRSGAAAPTATDHGGICESRHRGPARSGAPMAGRCVMTALRTALVDYLDLRRSLGFSLQRDAKLLAQFITYLEQRGTSTVTTAAALAWVTLPAP